VTAFSITPEGGQGADLRAVPTELAHTLTATDARQTDRGTRIVEGLTVRRLTPRECERLQGLPDDWTRYTADGTELADVHRYRMVGNAVAAPVAEWIGRRIMEAAT
jgi:DNA (cytosine-5)-methyltransferase 1